MKKFLVTSFTTLIIAIACSAFLQEYDLSKSIERGKEVYANNCSSCHMDDGSATTDLYPPLAKSDYLNNPVDTLINIVLLGQTGEIEVNGQKYNDEMLAQDYLTDDQVADVLNYVRNSWGNKMPAITPPQVKALRK